MSLRNTKWVYQSRVDVGEDIMHKMSSLSPEAPTMWN